MEKVSVHKILNEEGRFTEIEISGMLVLEYSQDIYKELLSLKGNLSNQPKITILNPEDIDLSFIQLIVAFINYMDENKLNHQIVWNLDDDQRLLLENVGLSKELYLNN